MVVPPVVVTVAVLDGPHAGAVGVVERMNNAGRVAVVVVDGVIRVIPTANLLRV